MNKQFEYDDLFGGSEDIKVSFNDNQLRILEDEMQDNVKGAFELADNMLQDIIEDNTNLTRCLNWEDGYIIYYDTTKENNDEGYYVTNELLSFLIHKFEVVLYKDIISDKDLDNINKEI